MQTAYQAILLVGLYPGFEARDLGGQTLLGYGLLLEIAVELDFFDFSLPELLFRRLG